MNLSPSFFHSALPLAIMKPSPSPITNARLLTQATASSSSSVFPPSFLTKSVKFSHRISRRWIRVPPYFSLSSNARSTRFLVSASASSGSHVSPPPFIQSDVGGVSWKVPLGKMEAVEEDIEKVIYRCRFVAFLGVLGSLTGSILCFIKGCSYVASSFTEYLVNPGKIIMLLVEAIDVYLLGTVMLVFGMGLYELFVSNLGSSKSVSEKSIPYRSNLFGLFTLKERPKWLDIKTVNELKTKLGHVIVMLLLIGLLENSKKAAINTPTDLLCFSASILLSSGSLLLLSKLTD